MKLLPLLALLLLASPARPQTDNAAAQIHADRIIRDGPLLRGTGHVRAQIGGLLLTGESGLLNTETDDIEVLGHATATLPARADRTLIRYGRSASASGEAVLVTADSLSVRSGLLLRGRGHVQAETRQWRLQADELDLFLKIGDGEMRGHIRLNGEDPETSDPRQLRRPFRFPPEIWK